MGLNSPWYILAFPTDCPSQLMGQSVEMSAMPPLFINQRRPPKRVSQARWLPSSAPLATITTSSAEPSDDLWHYLVPPPILCYHWCQHKVQPPTSYHLQCHHLVPPPQPGCPFQSHHYAEINIFLFITTSLVSQFTCHSGNTDSISNRILLLWFLNSNGLQNSLPVEFWWEKFEGNLRWANKESSMHFRKANTKPSMHFRKANIKPYIRASKTHGHADACLRKIF